MRVLVTRPEPGAEETAAALRDLGHEPVMLPLLRIEASGVAPDLTAVQALLVTSRNGIDAFAAATLRRDLPVMAVGERTAAAALAHGFASVRSADGDATDLAHMVRASLSPADGELLHISGADLAEDLGALLAPHGFAVGRAVLYRAVAAESLDPAAVLGARAALFFSPRSGTIFVRLARAAGLEAACDRLVALCLSARVAEAVRPLPWRAVLVADRPDQRRLLSLLSRMV
jgi:uroporphyrinogen-III synthase